MEKAKRCKYNHGNASQIEKFTSFNGVKTKASEMQSFTTKIQKIAENIIPFTVVFFGQCKHSGGATINLHSEIHSLERINKTHQ